MDAISKLPSIDTESAGADLLAHLLKEPADFIRSCADKLEGITVHPLVRKGCRLAEHSSLIEEHDVDLLVLNTRDDDQLAMHGLAHPLAIELRKTPLLML